MNPNLFNYRRAKQRQQDKQKPKPLTVATMKERAKAARLAAAAASAEGSSAQISGRSETAIKEASAESDVSANDDFHSLQHQQAMGSEPETGG